MNRLRDAVRQRRDLSGRHLHAVQDLEDHAGGLAGLDVLADAVESLGRSADNQLLPIGREAHRLQEGSVMEKGIGLPGLRVHDDDILHRGGAFRQPGMGACDEELAAVLGDILQVAGIAAFRKDGGVSGREVPFQEIGTVAPAGLPVVRLHDADDVRIFLEPFLDPAQDQVILRGRHRDTAPLGKVPGDDGFRTRFRVDLHEGIPTVQEKGLSPGHPARGDRVETRQLRAVGQMLYDAVSLRLRSIRHREMLQDIISVAGEFHPGNPFAVQEVVKGNGSLSKNRSTRQEGGAQEQKTKTSMHGMFWCLVISNLLSSVPKIAIFS